MLKIEELVEHSWDIWKVRYLMGASRTLVQAIDNSAWNRKEKVLGASDLDVDKRCMGKNKGTKGEIKAMLCRGTLFKM